MKYLLSLLIATFIFVSGIAYASEVDNLEKDVLEKIKQDEILYSEIEKKLISGEINTYSDFLDIIDEDISIGLKRLNLDLELQLCVRKSTKKRKIFCERYENAKNKFINIDNKKDAIFKLASTTLLKDINTKIQDDEYIAKKMVRYFVSGFGSLYDINDPDLFKFMSNDAYFIYKRKNKNVLMIHYTGMCNVKNKYGVYIGYKPCAIDFDTKKNEIDFFEVYEEYDKTVQELCSKYKK